MLKWLFTALFGDELSDLPPAGSGRSGDWDEKTFNRRLSKVVGKHRGEKIRDADQLSKGKYDEMDRHIRELNDLKDQISEARDRHRKKRDEAKELKPTTA